MASSLRRPEDPLAGLIELLDRLLHEYRHVTERSVEACKDIASCGRLCIEGLSAFLSYAEKRSNSRRYRGTRPVLQKVRVVLGEIERDAILPLADVNTPRSAEEFDGYGRMLEDHLRRLKRLRDDEVKLWSRLAPCRADFATSAEGRRVAGRIRKRQRQELETLQGAVRPEKGVGADEVSETYRANILDRLHQLDDLYDEILRDEVLGEKVPSQAAARAGEGLRLLLWYEEHAGELEARYPGEYALIQDSRSIEDVGHGPNRDDLIREAEQKRKSDPEADYLVVYLGDLPRKAD